MVLAIWLYLIAARGGFWRAAERDGERPSWSGPIGDRWPALAAVVPARDEAECVGQTVTSLLRQNYPGALTVIVVDDQSRDDTAEVARGAATLIGAGERLSVVPGRPLPAGWTGKLWAQQQGVECAVTAAPPTAYLLLTDADIVSAEDAITALVARAEESGFALTSLMVKLRCKSLAERMLVPAFIFFFQMLYPF